MKILYAVFLICLLVSLVGNACADFALILHGLESNIPGSDSKMLLSSYYVGQALGYVFLSPILSVLFDQVEKRWACIGVEILYSASLLAVLLLSNFGYLNWLNLFFLSAMIAGLAAIYRSGVTFSVLKLVSQHLGVQGVVSNYFVVFNLTVVLGSLLSGLVFRTLGFRGCILIAIATFLPMPVLYLRLFKKQNGETFIHKFQPLKDFGDGWKVFYQNKVLFFCSICIGIHNISGTIFPAVIGTVVYQFYPTRTDLVGIGIAASMFVATMFIPFFRRISTQFFANSFILISVIPLVLVLAACLVWLNPVLIVLAFTMACCGVTLTNIITGQIRVALVAPELTSRVNTAYFSLLSIGQIIGGAIVVPMLGRNVPLALVLVLSSYVIGGIIGMLTMPHIRIGEILGLKHARV